MYRRSVKKPSLHAYISLACYTKAANKTICGICILSIQLEDTYEQCT